jgi:hypothetical protein
MNRKYHRLGSLGLLLFILTAGARMTWAQTSAVSDYASLIAALNAGTRTITNFNATNSPGSPLTINFATVSQPEVMISNNITINAGTNSVVLQGNGGSRFFYVARGASLTLINLALINGGSTNGGAIYSDGTLVVSNCVLQGNAATNGSGQAGGSGQGNGTNGAPGGNAAGGAIYSTGSLYLYSSILTNNTSRAGSGGNGGAGSGVTANGGSAGYGGNSFGGAVYSTGRTNVFYMTEFSGNRCIAGSGGSGGSYGTNGFPPFSGNGGAAGLGGSCAGGAAYVAGSLDVTNCLFFTNYAQAGATGAAEVDASGGGAEGSSGGTALGGGLYVTNTNSVVWIQNSIFFYNVCAGGAGGSTTLGAAVGGTGGNAEGGGIFSSAGLVEISYSTLATNFLFAGSGGSNFDAGTNGLVGVADGWDIYRQSGATVLTASIASFDHAGTVSPNLVGVTDGGYNVCSDASLTRSTIVTTTYLNTDPILDSGLSETTNLVGGTFGSQMLTLAILANSPAAAFVPGVPGASFPAMDETLADRSTPTSAGAYEYNIIQTIVTNLALPTISRVTPPTNFVGAGATAIFTASISTAGYLGPPTGYQWQFNGSNIIDNGNYYGTTTNVLTIRHINFADQGQYTVLVSPTLLDGAVTSSVVYLVLTNPPMIKSEPKSVVRPVGGIVNLTLGVESPLNYFYQWKLDGTNLEGGSEYSGTNSNVLTIDPATLADSGLYQVIVTNNYGSRTSAMARVTIVPDHTRPSILIKSPALNNTRTNTLTLSGTASDNAQVTNVYYWITNINSGLNPVTNVLSGNATLTTNGNTNYTGLNTMLWTIPTNPLPGTNILAVQAVDYSSNVSVVMTRRFFYEVPSTLNLQFVDSNGMGGLTGHAFFRGDTAPSNNAPLNVGEGYTLVATPNSASLLGTWMVTTGTNVFLTNGNTLKFVMESNTTIVATFVSNIYSSLHGAYNGLFYVPAVFASNDVVTNGTTNMVVSTNAVYTNAATFATSGMLNNLQLGREGTFTARLLLAGGTYPFSGSFNAFGGATNTVARPAAQGGPLQVVLTLQTNGSGLLVGTVNNTNWPTNATLSAELAVPQPGVSNYTLLMAPDPSTAAAGPPGDSYALIADRNGTLTLRGGLADGTPFTQTVPLSQSNRFPLYLSLYERTGVLFGWLNLTNLSETNTAGELVWIKEAQSRPNALYPAGFTNLLLTDGSAWTNPAAITLAASNLLVVSNSSLDLNYTVQVKNKDQIYNAGALPANSLSGTINLATGFLQIVFGNGDGRAVTRGYGAYLQNADFGGGYFVTRTNGGLIILDVPEGTNNTDLPQAEKAATEQGGSFIPAILVGQQSPPKSPPASSPSGPP